MRTVLLDVDGSMPVSTTGQEINPRIGVSRGGAMLVTLDADLVFGDITVNSEFPKPDAPIVIINDTGVGDTVEETRNVYVFDGDSYENNFWFIQLKITTDETAPGADKVMQLFWDWLTVNITNTDLHYNPQYLNVTLPATANTTIYVQAPVTIELARYLHYWWVLPALPAGASLDIEVTVVPVYAPPDISLLFNPEIPVQVQVNNTVDSPVNVSIPTPVPVTGTFWQATQPVSGTFWQATQPVSGTFWQATQPVSIAADQVVNVTKEPVVFEKTSLVQNTWTQIFAGSTKATYIILCGVQAKVAAGAPTENADDIYIARKSGSDYYVVAKIEPGKSVQIGLTGYTDADVNNYYALAIDAGGSDGVVGEYQPTT